MGQNTDPEHKLRGYKAATHNPRVSDQARAHAQEEIDKFSSSQSGEDLHASNVKRGLKGAMHNKRVSGEAQQSARERLEEMGEPTE
ncbi:hypothetical protein N7492_009972 [Penicillium capsulatum]|uniref:Conidiation protein Con-6 n=1 Tax=Penicillium capsulatum TaxID=69766 RepID=A0A9W9HNN8_9EURO|nr:hypothetical protein N7492_009972 [Penicillium capsulatum]KAJ6112482.1 hypothetical protein N7512_007806 [Penicillium capsulatum]